MRNAPALGDGPASPCQPPHAARLSQGGGTGGVTCDETSIGLGIESGGAGSRAWGTLFLLRNKENDACYCDRKR